MNTDAPEEPQLLCVVEDVFNVTGRGPVISLGQWRTGRIRTGDWIELRSTDSGSRLAYVRSVETGRRIAPGPEPVVKAGSRAALLLGHIDRADIHKGDEVWSVVNPPVVAEPATTVPALERSWWQRLLERKSP